ncbi:phage tail protein [Methylobacterium oryzisoli]|uniref:phage tail protein n=1 Tax=Methylobacterium oryzisoli TaxID=3385502 RepID=UPI00397D62FA
MTIPTFYPPVAPSPGTTNKPELALLKAEFGDGYSLTVPNGLNHIRKVITLKWDVLTSAQAAQITAFLEERGGHQPFYYTPSRTSTPVKFTCEDWSETQNAAGLSAFTATLKQDFSLS